MKVECLSYGPVWLLGNESSFQRFSVVGVEATPKYGIALAFGYSPGCEEGLAEYVEIVVVVDYIGLFFHG